MPSIQAKLRPAEASARWARLVIQPSDSSGHASCSRMVLKRTNWPIVRSPLITSRPPKKTTAAIESVGRKNSPGRCWASTPACSSTTSRTLSAFSPKRSRTSSSRPNACTISMPTTASSAASVTSPLRCCTRREIGITRWANSQASRPISGSERPV